MEADTDYLLEVCVGLGAMHAAVDGVVYLATTVAEDQNRRKVGVGTGSAVSTGVLFDSFSFYRGRSPEDTTCELCSIEDCNLCSGTNEPDEIEVTIAGVVGTTCCSDYNGTYICTRFRACVWRYYFPVASCHSAEYIDVFPTNFGGARLSVAVNAAGGFNRALFQASKSLPTDCAIIDESLANVATSFASCDTPGATAQWTSL